MEFLALNYVFNVVTGLIPLVVLVVIIRIVSKDFFTEKKETLKKAAYVWVVLVLFLSLNTGGPKLTTDDYGAAVPSAPDKPIKRNEVPDFIEEVDRIGQFDQRIEEDNPRN